MRKSSRPGIIPVEKPGEVMYYWHVHVVRPMLSGLYCVAYADPLEDSLYPTAEAKARHVAKSYQSRDATVISSDYSQANCPYRELMHYRDGLRSTMSAPVKIQMIDGTEVDASGATCEGCGEPMDSHGCGSKRASNKGVARKAVSDHPECPHCGGRIHFNMSGTAINAECLTRQFALDNGLMTDPNERIPVLTLDMMSEIVEWNKTLAEPLKYGKMESAAGGAATYSGLRPKTGRKKKAIAAPAGSKIEDIAATVVEEPVVKSGKKSKGKGKSKKNQPAIVAAPIEESDEDIEAALNGTAPDDDDDTLEVIVPEPEPVVEATPKRRRTRASAAPMTAEPEIESVPEVIPEAPAPKARKSRQAAVIDPTPSPLDEDDGSDDEPFGAADVQPAAIKGEVIEATEPPPMTDRERRRLDRQSRREALTAKR